MQVAVAAAIAAGLSGCASHEGKATLPAGRAATPSRSICGVTPGAAANRDLLDALTAQYGEIRGCAVLEDGWMITTLGANGVIALLACHGNALCLDALQDHPLSSWTIIQPPYPGGVTVLTSLDKDTVIIDNGGHQLCFNVAATAFSPC